VAANRDSFFRNGAGLNTFSCTDHSLYLHNFDLTSRQTGRVRLDALRVDDWRDPLAGLGGKLEGELDLEKLGGMLRHIALFPPELSMAGHSRFSLSADTDVGGGRDGEAEIELADLIVKRGSETVWAENEVRASGKLESGEAGITQIRKLWFDSGALKLRSTGRIGSPGQREIALSGELIPDMNKIGVILRSGFDIDVAMTGKRPETFTFTYAGKAGGEERVRGITLDAALHADRLSFKGIRVQDAALPFTFRDGNLQLDFSGSLEGGEARAVADIDYTGQSPVIRVREGGQVLEDVQMQKPLVTALLSDIYPLFGVLADPAGRFGVRLDSLVWPLEDQEKTKASFVAVFDIKNLRFQPKGPLQDVLHRFGLNEKELAPRDNELYCLARAGRITCSPLSYSAGNAEITVSGSLGMDKTVDYLLELPVTGKLAGNKNYAALQGRKIRVAVSGSTDQPQVDEEKIDSDLEALVRQAAD